MPDLAELNKTLLRNVFRLNGIPEDAPARAMDHAGVPGNDLRKRVTVRVF